MSALDAAPFFPLPPAAVPGAIAVNVFAVLSAAALFSIVIRFAWLATLKALGRDNEAANREFAFFNTQLGYYAACLLIANMFNSVAGLIGLPALIQKGITQDGTCTLQGFVMQFGNISTAYYTIAIVVHTFNSLVVGKRQHAAVVAIAMLMGWVIAAVVASLPLVIAQNNGPIYGVTAITCGVRDQYPMHQFFLHLLPIFVTALVSAIVYSLIFLVLRGTLVIKGGVKVMLDAGHRMSIRESSYHRFVSGIARSMLWFPIAYVTTLVPYSVTRLLALSGYAVPFEAMVLAFVCWFLLGVVNVLLMYNVFRVLEPAFDGRSSAGGRNIPDGGFEPREKYNSQIEPKRASWDFIEKSDLLVYPSRSPTSGRSPMEQSNGYGRGPSFDMTAPPIGQPIMSREVLAQNAFVAPRRPNPAMTAARAAPEECLRSLPLPPRMTRRQSPTNSGATSPVATSPGLNRSSAGPRSSAEELDVASWLAQMSRDGSMARGMRNQPPLSAVRPTFADQSGNQRPAPGLPTLRLSGESWSSSGSSSRPRDLRFGTTPRGNQRQA